MLRFSSIFALMFTFNTIYGQGVKGEKNLELGLVISKIYTEIADDNTLKLATSISGNYHISKKISVGIFTPLIYKNTNNNSKSTYIRAFNTALIPYVRYDILNKKLCPYFIWGDIFSLGLNISKTNNLQIPTRQRKTTNINLNFHLSPKIIIPTVVGLKYQIKNKNYLSIWYSNPNTLLYTFQNEFGVSYQFYLNRD